MKVLCLHGMGTSGAIFTSQSASFRAKLDSNTYKFDFINAPLPSNPAPGIDIFFTGPYYAFYKSHSAAAIKEAHQWLTTILKDQGPYDCLMGFSQGCALISSYILYHAVEHPDEPLPFKAAFFICGGVPLSVLQDLGVHISQEAEDISTSTGRQLSEKAGAIGAELQAILSNRSSPSPSPTPSSRGNERRGLWDQTDTLLHDHLSASFPTDRKNVFGLDFTSFPEKVKIGIPTVHVYGCKDPRYPSAMQLAHLCDEEKRKTYDHRGGHDIPRTTVVSEDLAALVRWLEGMI